MKRRNKKGLFLVSHHTNTVFFYFSQEQMSLTIIPVDDNPVYITMKKIDLKRNTVYETITISGKPQLFVISLHNTYIQSIMCNYGYIFYNNYVTIIAHDCIICIM